jgi:hypothetical protein
VEIVRDLERAITVYMGAGPRRGVRGQPHMDVALRETVGCFGGAMQDGEVPDATAGMPSPCTSFPQLPTTSSLGRMALCVNRIFF